jgi:hypothetical protein
MQFVNKKIIKQNKSFTKAGKLKAPFRGFGGFI